MPVFFHYLISALAVGIPYLLVRIFSILGITFVTYQGFDLLLTNVRATIEGYFQGLPAVILDVMVTCNVDVYITMLFSSYILKVALGGFTKLRRVSA